MMKPCTSRIRSENNNLISEFQRMNTTSQLPLFADNKPAGLHYWPDFISADEERQLIAGIRSVPLQPFQFGAYQGKRKVASFGHRYDYSSRRLETDEPMPEWLRGPSAKIENFRGLPLGTIAQVLCTEYNTGTGIGWHRDKPHFDLVFGLSLGSACRFRFRRKAAELWQRYSLDAQPRSLYLIAGEARHVWQHSISEVEQPRYSITFRTMTR
jgi:alkylated DNA repair dioxygenase AlkB